MANFSINTFLTRGPPTVLDLRGRLLSVELAHMQNTNYSFLDLTVMPFLRRRVVSDDAAIVFDSEIKSVIWANSAGTKLFGGNYVGDLLEIELSQSHELVSQILNAKKQTSNDEPIVRGFRVSKGITSELIQAELTTKVLPNNNKVVLLVFKNNNSNKRKREHELATDAVNCLEGFADAAAIVDEFGLTIASSSKFDDMNVYPTALQELVQITSSEDDRMVKRPIQQSVDKVIAAGIGRIRDMPSRYLIVLADIEPQETAIEQDYTREEYSEISPPQNTGQNTHEIFEDDQYTQAQIQKTNDTDTNTISTSENTELSTDNDNRWYFNQENNLSARTDDEVTSQDIAKQNSDEQSADFTSVESHPLEPHSTQAPLRFSFTIGPDQIIRELSPELALSVGSKSADVIGMSWEQLCKQYGMDTTGCIGKLLTRTDTWSGKTILWPVENTDLVIPIDLAALPSFTKDRVFDGFRGFGIIRDEDAILDTQARGMNLADLQQTAPPHIKEPDTPIVPGLLSDEWESDKKDNDVGLRIGWGEDLDSDNDLGDDLEDGRDEAFNLPPKEATKSNVTSLNVVPIRSHVEITSQNTSQSHELNDEAEDENALSPKERNAFEDIRRRLQSEHGLKTTSNSRSQSDGKNKTLDANSDNPLDDDENTSNYLSSAVLVYRSDETLFANDELLNIAGYSSLEELNEAGGLDALLSADQLESDDNFSVLHLRRKDGVLINVQPTLKRVNWNGAKALSITFSKISADSTTHNTPDLSNENLDTSSTLDVVQISDIESILDTAADGVFVVNEAGKIEALNPSGEALFGKTFEDVKDTSFTDLFARESKAQLDEYFANLSNPGISGILNDGREVIGIEANGGMIPLFLTFGAIGKSKRYCAVLRDLTEHKKSEENLVTAKRKAEAASDQKTEFLSRISHEIREPLNAIIGFSDIMIEERFGDVKNERYKGYLRDINRSGIHMLDLVNDLLDISKIEAGKLDLAYEAVDLNQVARETVAMLQPQANNMRIIIRTSLSRAVPNVVADVRSIRQIITNLVSNAIKYSPSNSQVIVSTTYESNGEVGLRIRDTGNGMNKEELRLALEPYSQVGKKNEHSEDDAVRRTGTGLGLPLTKALVEANRAYFDLESTPGEGTIAHIQFPSPRVLAD